MTTYDIGHPAYKILAEIAEEAKWNPEFWREFEKRIRDIPGERWAPIRSEGEVYNWIARSPDLIRRRPRPRTVHVSGEIDREVWDAAHKVSVRDTPRFQSDARLFAQALLALTSWEGETREGVVEINGWQVPEPVREPVERRELYWAAIPDVDRYCDSSYWSGEPRDYRLLRRGLIHLTREAAEAHGRALASFTSREDDG